MRYLSVCSGIEAVSVAWQPLGWRPAMFAEIDPFCCWLLRSLYRASRPVHMPSPHDAFSHKEAKQRAAAIRNVIALPADGAIVNAGDFTKIGAENVGAIDLLAGGTPCQSFSVAGKRAGLDDPRGNLTIEFARLAGRLRPLWLVWENVPGVLSIDDGRTFGAFLGMLVELGYGIAYRVLDAQYFGVPQRRRRVFLVGYLGDWRVAQAVLLEHNSLSGNPPPRREALQGAARGVEVGPAGGRYTNTTPTIDAGCRDGFVRNQLGAGVHTSADEISHCLNAGGMGRQDFETETLIAHALSADGFDASEDGTGRGTPMLPVTICTAHTQSNGNGVAIAFKQNQEGDVLSGEVMQSLGTNSNATGRNAPTVAFTIHGSEGMARTASPTEVAGSLRTRAPGSVENSSTTAVLQDQSIASPLTGSHGKQIDSSDSSSGPPNLLRTQMAVRRLTPRECERLQGFPDDYTLVEYRGKLAADGPRYKALGNSMAVPVMRWLGQRIADVDAILGDGRGMRGLR